MTDRHAHSQESHPTRSAPAHVLRERGTQVTKKMLSECRHAQSPLTAFWIDLDRFRQVNDSFGHAGGDQLIHTVALRLTENAPEHSALVCMGGDEFVVLSPALSPETAQHSAQRLLNAVELPVAIRGIQVRPSASIGIARSEPRDSAAHLLERADRAMIDAKRHGGKRFVVSGHEDYPGRLGTELARRELAIESALHTAIESGGISLHFQPIVMLNGKLEAVEALMRCMVNGSYLRPVEFIPVAEKTGLIYRLGEWSLLQGARCAARLRDMGMPTKVAINVSRAQLLSHGFLPALHGALLCANVPPALIELELTESLFMDNSSTVQQNLRSIREAGVSLAIDDFGTGYSCLASLKDLPATKIKFDREFIRVLPADRRALAIVKSLSQLARDLGLTVVAEGVETQEQLIACKVAGTHATQGFIHAHAMPEHQLLAWMQSRDYA